MPETTRQSISIRQSTQRTRVGLLRGNTDFRRMWIGQSISQVGTQVSSLAVPLIAILTLNEPAFAVGALTAVGYSPYLIIGLPAGAWVDRLARRPVMIITDLLRAALLASVPISIALGIISLPLLFVVVFAVGVCTVFFEVAYRSYVPHLVGRDHLIEANSRLSASSTVAGTGGPALGGWLVSVMTAPLAVLVDAASYLMSAAYIVAINTRERPPRINRRLADGPDPHAASGMPQRGETPGMEVPEFQAAEFEVPEFEAAEFEAAEFEVAEDGTTHPDSARIADEKRSLRREIGAGMRFVLGDRVLRAIALYGSLASMFIVFEGAIEVLFLVRTVRVPTYAIGILLAVSSLGAVLGSFIGSAIRRRFGERRTMLGCAILGNCCTLLIPLTHADARLVFFALGVGGASCGVVVFNIVSMAVSQVRCPDAMLGRMSATMRFLSWSTLPIGGLSAGALAGAIGARDTLWLGTTGSCLSGLVFALLMRGVSRSAEPSSGERSVAADPR